LAAIAGHRRRANESNTRHQNSEANKPNARLQKRRTQRDEKEKRKRVGQIWLHEDETISGS
jgi:hypothetical protein